MKWMFVVNLKYPKVYKIFYSGNEELTLLIAFSKGKYFSVYRGIKAYLLVDSLGKLALKLCFRINLDSCACASEA